MNPQYLRLDDLRRSYNCLPVKKVWKYCRNDLYFRIASSREYRFKLKASRIYDLNFHQRTPTHHLEELP